MTPAHGGHPSRRTPGDRFAALLRRLRWPVVIVWLLAAVLLNGLSSSLSDWTNDTASAYLPSSAASAKVALLKEAAAQATAHTRGQLATYTTTPARYPR